MDGVDVGLLMSALGQLDQARTRHRRMLFNWLYYRAQSLLSGGTISFGDMLMLVAQHPSGAAQGGTERYVANFSYEKK